MLRVDIASGLVIAVFLALFVPTIGRNAQDARMLAAFVDDEPLITMQLDGMTVRPYGNPSNYLDRTLVKKQIPGHWYNIRYTNIPYYGGLYPDIALLLWLPLKLVGLPLFPSAPIILRSLSLLFSLCTLLALYNFCKEHIGRFAAIAGLLALAADYYFVFIGTVIHPDSLLFFLGFLGLAICLRHARTGTNGSLCAIGMAAGLAQGAKMGGPLLVPLTLVSMIIGLRSVMGPDQPALKWLGELAKRGVYVSSFAFLVFLLTTPYAVLDGYYVQTWKIWAKAFSGVHSAMHVGFRDWVDAFVGYVGGWRLAACGVAFIARLAFRRRFEDPMPVFLYGVLALTVFLWYAGFQKYWVQPQYLVLSAAFVSVMAGHLLDEVLSPLLAASRPLVRHVSETGTALALLVVYQGAVFGTLLIPVRYAEWRQSPKMLAGAWLSDHRSSYNDSVLFDTQAYFDPVRFPVQWMNGGPIKYTDLARNLPDYFALTVYTEFNWMSQKMASQDLPRWDDDYFSMRLYQDLLGRDHAKIEEVGATGAADGGVPGVTRVASFGSTKRESGLSCLPVDASEWSFAKWRCVARALCGGSCGTSGANMNTEILLFHLDAREFLRQAPAEVRHMSARAFASGTAVDYQADAILGDVGQVWLSARRGTAAQGEFVGIDFGQLPVEPKRLLIKWVSYAWLPGGIAVEFSDDERGWTTLARFTVSPPSDPAARTAPGTRRWEEQFDLPLQGAHRYWRVVARDMQEDHLFGLEKIRFL